MVTTAAAFASSPVTESLITAAESDRIDALPLPLLERQRLRLLAHSLRSLQAAAGRCAGALPTEAELEQWACSQPQLAADAGFRSLLIKQLQAAGSQLEQLAISQRPPLSPLELSLELLLAAAPRQNPAEPLQHQRALDDPPPND